ncbi:RNA polymerase subunit sigma-70 [Mycobacterium antarcticum]|uniref:RNA polymerase subunit sigma-70 n=1 Tax=Mycolicibacterium sp. TUM20984 TaxID=3023368 RepID=UPI0024E0B604|nr:RNA polymerase subunit sigma-70 [Mycolicibacterium sp. TUM20984]
MPVKEDFIAHAEPYRSELTAHCYRMLGSVHDAEDLVQETYLRGWQGYEKFEERAALRTWLYRIATHACLRVLEGRSRRVMPAGLGDASADPATPLDTGANGHSWMEPLPDRSSPEEMVVARNSVRLAIATALQELPASQRAVLILRDVAQFSAAEVAALLSTTPAAVNSAMQRARAHLNLVAPAEDAVSLPADERRRAMLDRYCGAFERGDVVALTELLRADVALEMPPLTTWFVGRDAVTGFLAARALGGPGEVTMLAIRANGQAAAAAYRLGADGMQHAHALHVLTEDATGEIATVSVFLDVGLFDAFGLPVTRSPADALRSTPSITRMS